MTKILLLDNEGRSYGEFNIPELIPIFDLPIAPKINVTAIEPPWQTSVGRISFRPEQQRGDGVWIYRRSTPYFK